MSSYKKVDKSSKVIEEYESILKDCTNKSDQYFRTIKNVARRNPATNGKSINDIIDNAYPHDSEHKIVVMTLKDVKNISKLFASLYELVDDDTEEKE